MVSPLDSRRMILRPICDGDNQQLCEWRNDVDYLKMVSNKRSLVSLEAFVSEQKRAFQTDRHLQFMIELKKDGLLVPIGTAYTFNFNLTDGHVFLNLYIEGEYRGCGYGPEAGVLTVCYLFDFFPLYKVCFESFGYNDPSISMMKTVGLGQEGVFKGQRFFGGERFDIVRFAAYRDSLDRIRRLCERFQKKPKAIS